MVTSQFIMSLFNLLDSYVEMPATGL